MTSFTEIFLWKVAISRSFLRFQICCRGISFKHSSLLLLLSFISDAKQIFSLMLNGGEQRKSTEKSETTCYTLEIYIENINEHFEHDTLLFSKK